MYNKSAYDYNNNNTYSNDTNMYFKKDAVMHEKLI